MLDEEKIREIDAVTPVLELEESSYHSYEKLVILKALKFFQYLDEAGGLPEILSDKLKAFKENNGEESPYSLRRRPSRPTVETYSDSEFLLAVSGKDSAEAWAIMDGVMTDLRSYNVKAYNAAMRKIREL